MAEKFHHTFDRYNLHKLFDTFFTESTYTILKYQPMKYKPTKYIKSLYKVL